MVSVIFSQNHWLFTVWQRFSERHFKKAAPDKAKIRAYENLVIKIFWIRHKFWNLQDTYWKQIFKDILIQAIVLELLAVKVWSTQNALTLSILMQFLKIKLEVMWKNNTKFHIIDIFCFTHRIKRNAIWQVQGLRREEPPCTSI